MLKVGKPSGALVNNATRQVRFSPETKDVLDVHERQPARRHGPTLCTRLLTYLSPSRVRQARQQKILESLRSQRALFKQLKLLLDRTGGLPPVSVGTTPTSELQLARAAQAAENLRLLDDAVRLCESNMPPIATSDFFKGLDRGASSSDSAVFLRQWGAKIGLAQESSARDILTAMAGIARAPVPTDAQGLLEDGFVLFCYVIVDLKFLAKQELDRLHGNILATKRHLATDQ